MSRFSIYACVCSRVTTSSSCHLVSMGRRACKLIREVKFWAFHPNGHIGVFFSVLKWQPRSETLHSWRQFKWIQSSSKQFCPAWWWTSAMACHQRTAHMEPEKGKVISEVTVMCEQRCATCHVDQWTCMRDWKSIANKDIGCWLIQWKVGKPGPFYFLRMSWNGLLLH